MKLRLNCNRYLPASGLTFQLVVVLVQLLVAVLAHGTLHAFAGDKEYGALPDAHPVVGDAFEVVDGERSPDTPLRGAAVILARVDRQVHGLRVEQVDLVIGSLEVPRTIYVAGLEDIQTLTEQAIGTAAHFQEGGFEVGITLGIGALDNRLADVLTQSAGAHQVVL